MEDLLDESGCFSLPIGADDHVVARSGAGGPAAHVPVVEGIRIGQLHGVVARFRDSRNRDHRWFGAQIDLHQAIGVSLFGVITAVSLYVNTRASLVSVPIGALNWPEFGSTNNSYAEV